MQVIKVLPEIGVGVTELNVVCLPRGLRHCPTNNLQAIAFIPNDLRSLAFELNYRAADPNYHVPVTY
jgi:hypothetical protein